MTLFFVVDGEPVAKARPRVVNGHAFTPKKTVEYENKVRESFVNQCGSVYFEKGVPLEMNITAYYQIPKSKPEKVKIQMENRIVYPTKKPDLDNVIKSIADACNGLVYHDDSQIVRVRVSKIFSYEPKVEVSIKNI